MTNQEKRARVEEHLAEILDGEAPAELYDLVAESDECRDLRYDAERAAELVRDAGSDYVLPSDLEERVFGALDASANAAPPVPPPTEAMPLLDPMIGPAAIPTRPAPVVPLLSPRQLLVAGGGLLGGLAVLAMAAAAVIVFRVAKPRIWPGPAEGWSGTVEHVAGQGKGLELCDGSGKRCQALSRGGRVRPGSLVKTDERTRAQLKLQDGTELFLDRSTRLALSTARAREARLESGMIVADVARNAKERARFELPVGSLEVLGTKFALRTTEDSASVDVSRGEVRLKDSAGRAVSVRAGEEGLLRAGQAPYATSTVALGESLAWSDSALESRDQEVTTRGLGELRSKKPGEQQERENAVTLTSHAVKVRISGAVARTEVDEVFANHTSEVLEGIYRFPLPPDAKLERLALEVDGKLEEGAFVDRDRAAAIWRGAIVNAAPQLKPQMRDEIIWVPGPWRDPALLEWQRGGRFELRIYPIPKQGSRRVVLAYTQNVQPTGGVRRYTYPLAYDPSGSTRVADFKVDIEVRGHDEKIGVRSRGYELVRGEAGPGVGKLTFAQQGFSPSGDLGLEYGLPERGSELTAWAFQPATDPKNSAPYVALALRPKLPRAEEGERRAYALVVDSSRSMFGESYRRATAVAGRVVGELGPEDRFTALACDTTCRTLGGGMREPGPEAAEETRRWLAGIVPEGASDLAEAIRSAASAAQSESGRALRLVYIGDGTPTVGPIRPGYLTRAVETALPRERGMVIAVGVGVDSDLDSLRAVARGGGGVVLPYTPGETTAEAAYAVLGASYGHALRDVRVKLPEGLVEAAPEKVDTIPAGSESIVVARMTRPEVEGVVVVEGKVGSQPFEQRYPVKVAASTSPGNAFVPRLYAATRIADLEQKPDADAKKQAIELSTAFNVASRHTSLLVLESQAMLNAFGLDNRRKAPEWTGEETADSSESKGEVAMADKDEERDDAHMRLGAGAMRPGAAGGGLGGLPPVAKKKRSLDYDAFGDMAAASAPTAAPAPQPQSAPAAEAKAPARTKAGPPVVVSEVEPPRDSRRTWIPMRRVWDRVGDINTARNQPKAASADAIAQAERDASQNENRRGAVKKLYTLYAMSGDLERARSLAERWSEKEPLDPEALTARADMAARAGDRETAIRILGSVVDVRPGDVKAQQRLARLYRWSGQPVLGCHHSLAIAQLGSKDSELLADAVRCARETGLGIVGEDLLSAAETATRSRAEQLLKATPTEAKLLGDLRLEASWNSGPDLDLGLIDPDGNRISWLGAPTRAVISATSVTSPVSEGLGLRGAKPGEYLVEIVRTTDTGPVSGTLKITAANTTRTVPFTLDGTRTVVGLVTIRMEPRLVRAW
jgi:tetratricopeptide (TPR) repeat protein